MTLNVYCSIRSGASGLGQVEELRLATAFAAAARCECAINIRTGAEETLSVSPEEARVLALLAAGELVPLAMFPNQISTSLAAEILERSKTYVLQLISDGRLPCQRIGRHRRLSLLEVLRLRESRSGDQTTDATS